jgi:integrase
LVQICYGQFRTSYDPPRSLSGFDFVETRLQCWDFLQNSYERSQTFASGLHLYDPEGRRLYFTDTVRRAFSKPRPWPRTRCGLSAACSVQRATGCRISEVLTLTTDRVDLAGRLIGFRSIKKRRSGVY